METITVNGIEYEEIIYPKVHRPKLSPEIATLMMIYGGGMLGTGRTRSQNTPQVDIVKEFELIQQKKSNLSRSERESVCRQFNKMYRKAI